MNKKLKTGNAVVIAILVVLVIGLIIALTITITSLVKINNANKDGDSNINKNNHKIFSSEWKLFHTFFHTLTHIHLCQWQLMYNFLEGIEWNQ